MSVSVLLPARNAAKTIDAAIASVLADAGERPIQLVAIDDGSTDATAERIEVWCRKDSRVEMVGAEGKGLVAALNLGLIACRERFIARMDADDIWLAGRFQTQLGALEREPSLAGVGGEVEIFNEEEPVRDGMRHYESWLNAHHAPDEIYRERYVESPLCHPAVLLRASVLKEARYREGDFPEDYELWLRLLSSGARLANVPSKVLRWRDSTTRLTRTNPKYSPQAHLALKVDYLARETFAFRPLVICGAGRTGLPLARALLAKGLSLARFVEVHPRKIGTRILERPVIGYESLGPPGEEHLLVAVGAKGARFQIRSHLLGLGYVEGEHFTCVA